MIKCSHSTTAFPKAPSHKFALKTPGIEAAYLRPSVPPLQLYEGGMIAACHIYWQVAIKP